MKIKKNAIEAISVLFLFAAAAIISISGVSIIIEGAAGANITNDSVTTKVNITNGPPEVYSVTVKPDPVDLTPGGYINVICNASVYDPNGWDDITTVTGALYDIDFGNGATGDDNYRYLNSSCDFNASQSCVSLDGSQTNASCVCTFPVQYYANNGSWQCNVSVGDTYPLNSTNLSSATKFNTVLGIDVPAQIDFGDMSVTEISNPSIRENITNYGNVALNVSVRGYGGDQETASSKPLAMVCGTSGSLNISAAYEKYSLLEDQTFALMQNISNTSRVLNLTIPVRSDDTAYGNSSNATFWKLQIPTGVTGVCNGTVIFGAVDASA